MGKVSLTHPDLVHDEVQVVVPEYGVDGAGYRPIAAMVETFKRAGVQLETFRAAEFSGDLSLNPLHRSYVDPVDRDEALKEALQRSRQAKKDFDNARRVALDKRVKEREDEIERVAERIRRRRDAQSRKSEVPAEESSPPVE